MITDARALRQDHVPQELHHREGKIDEISSALKPVSNDDPGEDILIHGKSGTGKTTIAKYVLDHLKRETLDVEWGYTNCISNASKTDILYSLLRDTDRGADLRKEGTSASTFLDRLQEIDGQFVAILDEVDVVDDMTTLLSLYELSNVTMVLICVDEDRLFRDLDIRVDSRLRSAQKVELDPYDNDELADILWGRAEAGLEFGAINDKTINYIADIAAGDARLAIALLRQSARYVEDTDIEDRITVGVVNRIADDAKADIATRYVEKLSTHQRILYEIIADAGEISGGDLHSKYEHRATEPKGKSMRRKYLQSMSREDLIEKEGEGRGRRYRLIDH
ncbi:Cdc6/Cdc18 family protein [Halorussus marinus]|uniref:Cdc6/Cdc18 family protein n=1 Tax=Halorussus marinus TaxID=2505976 RepID=UPI001092E05A|nr:Cdc6/Cdc18 family protein [Halorussus marinus]